MPDVMSTVSHLASQNSPKPQVCKCWQIGNTGSSYDGYSLCFEREVENQLFAFRFSFMRKQSAVIIRISDSCSNKAWA